MSGCCETTGSGQSSTWTRRARELFAWMLPSVTLLLVPKCPACLAAQLALWTGLGFSLPVATYLRWALLLVCVGSLVWLVVERLRRIQSNFSHLNMETESCNTKS